MIRCGTCRGACCYTPNGIVKLTEDDVKRIIKAYGTEWLERYTVLHKITTKEGITVLHTMHMIDVSREVRVGAKGCIALKADGCSIYENRPDQCRDFSPEDCGMYQEDSRKVSGKLRLRVVS